jgi:hypothetical protein
MADELGVDTALAHASGDQLRVLAAEVDDEDGALLGRLVGDRERDYFAYGANSRDGSSGIPS